MTCMFGVIHFCLQMFFWKFRDTCIEIYGLGPSHLLSAPGLAWKACLKKTNVNLEVLTNIDMLLMIEAGIRGGTC